MTDLLMDEYIRIQQSDRELSKQNGQRRVAQCSLEQQMEMLHVSDI